MPAPSLPERVLARLAQAEACEPNPHYRDDLRIARLTVYYAASGEAVLCSPHVLASYMVLGLHPEKVWPAILARRKALVGSVVSGAPPVPKKPAQSVKLWQSEKNKSAELALRAACNQVLGEPPISVPMAAPSIAALFPNSGAASSAKKGEFTYDELLVLVRKSFAPESVVQATVNALTARGRWPKSDGPVNGILCVSLEGMMLGGLDGNRNVVRSTARWRARRAVKLGYWRLLRQPNSWSNCPKCGAERRKHPADCNCGACPTHAGTCEKCGYTGKAKTSDGKANFDEFCRPYMYEIDVEKFRHALPAKGIRDFNHRTYQEHKAAAKRGEHPNVTEMPSRKPVQPDAPAPKPPAPSAPLPQRQQPAAQREQHHTRSIGRDARMALFNAYIALKRSGKSHEESLAEIVQQFKNRFSAEDVEFAVKIVGHRNGQDVTAEPQGPRREYKPSQCHTCEDTGQIWNKGPGPRKLPCPDCAESAP
jgi:hypothetical protein